MSSAAFTSHFWFHLERPLRNLCIGLGRCIAAGVEDYSAAYHTILHDAIRHGALHLRPDDFDALQDWLADNLLQEIIRAEAEGWQHWPHHQAHQTHQMREGTTP